MKDRDVLKGTVFLTVIALIIAALIIFVPLGFIWSLNTLFQLGIAYTLKTWAAALILIMLFSVKSYNERKKQ